MISPDIRVMFLQAIEADEAAWKEALLHGMRTRPIQTGRETLARALVLFAKVEVLAASLVTSMLRNMPTAIMKKTITFGSWTPISEISMILSAPIPTA
jgi:hypothetical protein